jgi:hypothetical protein
MDASPGLGSRRLAPRRSGSPLPGEDRLSVGEGSTAQQRRESFGSGGSPVNGERALERRDSFGSRSSFDGMEELVGRKVRKAVCTRMLY